MFYNISGYFVQKNQNRLILPVKAGVMNYDLKNLQEVVQVLP